MKCESVLIIAAVLHHRGRQWLVLNSSQQSRGATERTGQSTWLSPSELPPRHRLLHIDRATPDRPDRLQST